MGRYNKRTHDLAWASVEAVARASSFVGRAIEIAGNVASFAVWKQSVGLNGGRHFVGREALWRSVVFPRLAEGPVTVLELGVASGDTTRYWLSNVPNPQLRWHGFDTFTGLPQAWERGGIQFAAEGTFDAGGKTPEVDDPRAEFHVGLVEETLPAFDVGDGRLCVIFDLDLYAPSAFALSLLEPKLKPGDLLYFDEAYDPWHERLALAEFLPRHELAPLGSTGVGLAVEYVGPRSVGTPESAARAQR